MKTRILAMILVSVLAFQLVGCGQTQSQSDASWENVTEDSSNDSGAESSSNAEPSSAEESSSAETATWSTEEPKSTNEPIKYFPLKPSIEETVLYDQEGVRILATNISYSSYRATIDLTLENQTDKDLSFYSNTLAYGCNSINGHMFSFGYVSEDVPAGEIIETDTWVDGSELVLYGITDIADMELGFRITGDDMDDILTGPCSIKTELADTYDYSVVSIETGITDPRYQDEYGYSVVNIGNAKIYDVLGVIIDSEVILKNKDEETVIGLEVKNTGEEIRNLSLGKVTINGLTMESGTWTTETVNPGKTATLDCNLDRLMDESIRKLAGISEIGAVTFELTLKDLDYNDLADPAKVSLTLSGNGNVNSGTEIYRSEQIVVYQLGVVPDESKYSDDYHIVLIYENLTDDELEIRYPFDGFVVNDSTDVFASTWTVYLSGKEKEIDDIQVYASSFEDAGITSWDDITDVSMKIEVSLDYSHTLDETTLIFDPTVTILENN